MNKNKNNGSTNISGLAFFSLIILFIILIIIYPFLMFWCGYIDGWIAEQIVGDNLCHGLNVLFNTAFFTPDKLPWIGGALAWIGSFFKSVGASSKLGKDK